MHLKCYLEPPIIQLPSIYGLLDAYLVSEIGDINTIFLLDILHFNLLLGMQSFIPLYIQLSLLESSHFSLGILSYNNCCIYSGDNTIILVVFNLEFKVHLLTVQFGRLLGTPNEETWPGVSKLRDWHEYPQWQYADIAKAVPHLDAKGVDLLSVSPHVFFF